MNSIILLPAALAAACTATAAASSDTGAELVGAARLLLVDLERGRAVHAQTLRKAMSIAFGGSDAALAPSHTRRFEESQALQKFYTPIELGLGASVAAAVTSDDLVLKPSAGTGLAAIHAELAGARLHRNELADARVCLLDQLFGGIRIIRYDTAHIHDHLEGDNRPTVELMNPPFSVAAHVDGRVADAALRHVSSALARLADGGRLVAITGASLSPDNPTWRESFVGLQERARLVFSAAIAGPVFARHATTETRLIAIDRLPADDPTARPASPWMASDAGVLLDWVTVLVPPRPTVTAASAAAPRMRLVAPRIRPTQRILPSRTRYSVAVAEPAAVELTHEIIDWAPEPGDQITAALYEEYALQSICIRGSRAHPIQFVQSAAMASVPPPKPNYRLHLPPAVIADDLPSDAQFESVIYAGKAHGGYLAGARPVDETLDVISAAADDVDNAVRFRRGWFLGDSTGAGRGRQVGGILLDKWLKGRRRAVWISKSDKLIDDTQHAWSALGQERLLITPLSRFRSGMPIRLEQGILFTTHATLRSDGREEKLSRVLQIVDWLGDFDGAVVFDESHAMQNAAGEKSERGERATPLQGKV